jgi:hypothetical protein
MDCDFGEIAQQVLSMGIFPGIATLIVRNLKKPFFILVTEQSLQGHQFSHQFSHNICWLFYRKDKQENAESRDTVTAVRADHGT